MNKLKMVMEKWKIKNVEGVENKIRISKKMALLMTVVLVIVGTGSYIKVKGMGQKTEDALRLPDIAVAETGDLSKRVTASGTTEAADPISIFIELSQEVLKVYAEVGDKVTTEQLLVTYNIADTKKELSNKLAEAQVTLDNAQISLKDLESPATGAELIELKSQVANAEKSLADLSYEMSNMDVKISQGELAVNNAEKTMEDQKALLAVGGVSQADYDSAKESYDEAVIALQQLKDEKSKQALSFTTAELALEKATINLENGQNVQNDTATANAILKQQNTVKSAQRNVTSIQDEISKLTEATYSPIAGTVIESNAVEGQMLTDSTVMMKVADLSNMDVTALVSEYDIASIQVGQKVEMQSDGIPDKVYTGVVTKIEPSATSQSTMSGTETVVPITVHMQDTDDLVKPGFSFDLEIIVEDLSEVLYIPVSAVGKNEDDSHYAFIIDEEETLRKTAVEIGSNNDEYVVIISGLNQGDKVIASPTEAMVDGGKRSDYGTVAAKKATQEDSMLDSITSAPSSTGGGMQGGDRPSGGGMPSGGPR